MRLLVSGLLLDGESTRGLQNFRSQFRVGFRGYTDYVQLFATVVNVFARLSIRSNTSCGVATEGWYPLYKSFPPTNKTMISFLPCGGTN